MFLRIPVDFTKFRLKSFLQGSKLVLFGSENVNKILVKESGHDHSTPWLTILRNFKMDVGLKKKHKDKLFSFVNNKLHHKNHLSQFPYSLRYLNYSKNSLPVNFKFNNNEANSKQKSKSDSKEDAMEDWGGPEAHKLIIFLKDDFDAQIQKHQQILVFFSANWCPHCLKLRKPFSRAALMSKEANLPMAFATYDVNYNPEFAQEKGVVGIPLIRYYKHGNFITNYQGKRSSEEIFEFAKNPPTKPFFSKNIDF